MAPNNFNRRQFIQATALGAVTAGLGTPLLRAEPKDAPSTPEILYRTLGRTKLSLPLLSFGVMNSDSPELIHKGLDMGITHLDTAHVYMRGKSERAIGKVLEDRGGRDKVYIATKMRFEKDRRQGNLLQ